MSLILLSCLALLLSIFFGSFYIVIYIFIALLGFIFGFFYQIKKIPEYRLLKRCTCIAGLKEIVENAIKDYVLNWYQKVTPDENFPADLHKAINRVLTKLIKYIEKVDWSTYITEELPNHLATHIRIYRKASDLNPHNSENTACSTDHFIQALRVSDSEDELNAVLRKLTEYTERLRGKDSGGDNGTLLPLFSILLFI
ncbi:sorting nexin 13 [Cichlidogyrus casuarinus]|uniref:Sorting nexin 13 n=1 Tax=Cichlidogyrus casuarinus TaxID=1844966 RepID=A0ABD2Q0K1_9PLAT